MQIISGMARGINLEVPDGFDIRPTGVRARKALFDSLNIFRNLKILDIFAGSGALGLEAASRGAASVTFVEHSKKHCEFIEENINRVLKTGVDCEFKTICGNASNPDFLSTLMVGIDIIFADPPYANSAEYLHNLVDSKTFVENAKGLMLVWEVPGDVRDYTPYHIKKPWISVRRKFGSTEFLLLKMHA